MKKSTIYMGVALLVLVLAVFMWWPEGENAGEFNNRDNEGNVVVASELQLSFVQPEGYDITRAEDTQVGRYSYILSREEDRVVPEYGEGAPALTIDIFRDANESNVREWLESNDVSNINLMMGDVLETKVDSEDALAYEWDGLYRGRSVAFEYEGSIVLISGTYLEASDPIYEDFDQLVSSIKLD